MLRSWPTAILGRPIEGSTSHNAVVTPVAIAPAAVARLASMTASKLGERFGELPYLIDRIKTRMVPLPDFTRLTTACAAVLASLAFVPAASAQSSPSHPDTSAVTPAMIDAGRKIFHGKGTCFACHGSNLEGGPVAPPLTAHPWKDAKGGDLAAIFYVDTHGVAGTMMIAHPGGISDTEAGEVAAYIWAVSHRGVKP